MGYQNREIELERKITDLEGWKAKQIMQMEMINKERRNAGEKPIGRDSPPCWVRKESDGRFVEEDSFHIEIRDNGVIVRNISPEHRKKDFEELPPVPLEKHLSFKEFKKETLAVLKWEQKKDCRFRVRICENAKDKGATLQALDVIDVRFYKTLKRDECAYVGK